MVCGRLFSIKHVHVTARVCLVHATGSITLVFFRVGCGNKGITGCNTGSRYLLNGNFEKIETVCYGGYSPHASCPRSAERVLMAEVIAGGCRRTDDEIGSMSDKPKDTGGKLLYFPRQEENQWLVDRSGCQHPRWHRVTSTQLFETGVGHSSTEFERSIELGQSAIGSFRTALWCRSAALMILAATLVYKFLIRSSVIGTCKMKCLCMSPVELVTTLVPSWDTIGIG